MFLMDYLQQLIPDLIPEVTKIHLARHNGHDDPLDVFIAGEFDEWQRWQSKRNFSRPYIVSLIQAKHSQRWLYAGTYTVLGVEDKQPRDETWQQDFYRYDLRRMNIADEYAGRMYVQSVYKGRTSFLNGETLNADLLIQEISPVKLTFGDFPGYKTLVLTRDQLEIIIRHDLPTWRTALQNVKGVYLITDTIAGKLYVGKASGTQGFWARWSYYFTSVHGDNVGLIEELGSASPERLGGLRFSILEVMDPNATEDEVLARESHWKNVLLSRQLGYNKN
jgi:hypothetical protein